jgi:hypothetical protein
MRLPNLIYEGRELRDEAKLNSLPPELGSLLREVNGFIAFGGGLHIRGLCGEPQWHSIERHWNGEKALRSLYSEITEDDLPFGQDCVGDQFFLRSAVVHKLCAEYGEVESWDVTLPVFLERAAADPLNYLSTEPLLAYLGNSGPLEPGHLIFAYPPFVAAESGKDSRLASVPIDELMVVHSRLAAEMRNLPEGAKFRVEVE